MNVLIADSAPIALKILRGMLISWGYSVEAHDDGQSTLDALTRDAPPRLAVIDWNLPNINGPEICKQLRKRGTDAYTYVILLSAAPEKEEIALGLEAGADDHITKPFHAVELRARLRAGHRIINLHNALLEAQEDLRHQATTDLLTGIDNRAALLKHLYREINRARRQNTTVAVMMLDLDHFKSINDTHGHLVGDEVLRHVADALKLCVRDYENLGRYGGEEFMIILTDVDDDTAIKVGERILSKLAKIDYSYEGHQIPITGSIGAVVSLRGVNANSESLIHAADKALYVAKHRGRNQIFLAPASSIKHTISPVPVQKISRQTQNLSS